MYRTVEIITLWTTEQCPDNRSCTSIHKVADEPGEHELPAGLIERDFWIIGDSVVVTMYHDEHGRLEVAEVAEVADSAELADHLHTRDTAWPAAEPFTRWWARHPELRQKAA